MNLYLHGIGGESVAIHTGHDSLAAPWSHEYSLILANPPFGKKQSLLFVNQEGNTEKEDQGPHWSSSRRSPLGSLAGASDYDYALRARLLAAGHGTAEGASRAPRDGGAGLVRCFAVGMSIGGPPGGAVAEREVAS